MLLDRSQLRNFYDQVVNDFHSLRKTVHILVNPTVDGKMGFHFGHFGRESRREIIYTLLKTYIRQQIIVMPQWCSYCPRYDNNVLLASLLPFKSASLHRPFHCPFHCQYKYMLTPLNAHPTPSLFAPLPPSPPYPQLLQDFAPK